MVEMPGMLTSTRLLKAGPNSRKPLPSLSLRPKPSLLPKPPGRLLRMKMVFLVLLSLTPWILTVRLTRSAPDFQKQFPIPLLNPPKDRK